MCCSCHHFFSRKDTRIILDAISRRRIRSLSREPRIFPLLLVIFRTYCYRWRPGCYFYCAYPTKRTSLASYPATSAVILPPSPERVAKRARALIVERTSSAVQAAEEATSDLVTRFQKLQTCYDSAKLKIVDLNVKIFKLKQNNLSQLSMQSARTERDLEASAVFDRQDQHRSTDTTAGRQLFQRR
jgi:hypothetical protein